MYQSAKFIKGVVNFEEWTIMVNIGDDTMKNKNIRLAEQADLDEIEQIYAHARQFMADNGNPTQ